MSTPKQVGNKLVFDPPLEMVTGSSFKIEATGIVHGESEGISIEYQKVEVDGVTTELKVAPDIPPISPDDIKAILAMSNKDTMVSREEQPLLIVGASSHFSFPAPSVSALTKESYEEFQRQEQERNTYQPTVFERVEEMCVAYNQPKGDAYDIDADRLLPQFLNMPEKIGILFVGLGADPAYVNFLVEEFCRKLDNSVHTHSSMFNRLGKNQLNLDKIREGLCDLHILSYSGHHTLGIDADEDLHTVLSGIMTGFIKDEAEKETTIAHYAAAGITDVYFEGQYPTLLMRAASDQGNVAKDTRLESVNYKEPVFRQP